MSASSSAVILSTRSLALIVVSLLCSFAIVPYGYRRPMFIGIPLVSIALFLLSLGLHDIGISNRVWLSLVLILAGIGLSFAAPAANNATRDVAPDKITSVSAIRVVFRNVGGIIGAAGVVLTLSRFTDKGEGLERAFLTFSILLFSSIILVFFIPDIAKRKRDAAKT